MFLFSPNVFFRAKLSMPQYLSIEAQSLLRSLFKRNPSNRLGSGPRKGQEVKDHDFFSSIDFEKLLRKEVKPPYIPALAPNDSQFYFSEKQPKNSSIGKYILLLFYFGFGIFYFYFL